jgi:hypothetical protein
LLAELPQRLTVGERIDPLDGVTIVWKQAELCWRRVPASPFDRGRWIRASEGRVLMLPDGDGDNRAEFVYIEALSTVSTERFNYIVVSPRQAEWSILLERNGIGPNAAVEVTDGRIHERSAVGTTEFSWGGQRFVGVALIESESRPADAQVLQYLITTDEIIVTLDGQPFDPEADVVSLIVGEVITVEPIVGSPHLDKLQTGGSGLEWVEGTNLAEALLPGIAQIRMYRPDVADLYLTVEINAG